MKGGIFENFWNLVVCIFQRCSIQKLSSRVWVWKTGRCFLTAILKISKKIVCYGEKLRSLGCLPWGKLDLSPKNSNGKNECEMGEVCGKNGKNVYEFFSGFRFICLFCVLYGLNGKRVWVSKKLKIEKN